MTMQHETHPHDERLAALAEADAEATDDRALRDHVASCDRCRAVVDDLRLLRSALAELPDLRPSRPLQLLPPVAAPAAPRAGALGFLRRLTAPAMAAGVALILVGAVGSTGILAAFGGLAGSAAQFQNVGEDLGAAAAASHGGSQPGGSAYPGAFQGQAGSPSPTSSETRGVVSGPADSGQAAQSPALVAPDHGGTAELGSNAPSDPRFVWLLVLAVGVALLGGSLLLRFTVQPSTS
jgi:hypothetical protein